MEVLEMATNRQKQNKIKLDKWLSQCFGYKVAKWFDLILLALVSWALFIFSVWVA
jgi:hypothetical protein